MREQFKKNHDAIIEAMTHQQYFNWHNNFFNGELDYKHRAWSIFHSTRSKKIRVLCLKQIEYYDSVFGTEGFQLKGESV